MRCIHLVQFWDEILLRDIWLVFEGKHTQDRRDKWPGHQGRARL